MCDVLCVIDLLFSPKGLWVKLLFLGFVDCNQDIRALLHSSTKG